MSNKDRTIDLPFDETYKLYAAYAWNTSKRLDVGLGATLLYFGDGRVDQAAQGYVSRASLIPIWHCFRVVRYAMFFDLYIQ